MNLSARLIALAAAVLSLTAVILAAMGSHMVDLNGMQHLWQTAVIMHLFNAAALLGLAALHARLESGLLKWGAWMIAAGTLIFCGSIYLHVISGHTVPRLTPSGGLLMMAGWLLTAVAFVRRP